MAPGEGGQSPSKMMKLWDTLALIHRSSREREEMHKKKPLKINGKTLLRVN